MTFRLAVVLGLILLMIATSCQISSNTTTITTPPASNSATLLYSVTPDSGPLIALCKADLAEITGLTQADITVVSASPFTFSDTSLGCREPGKSYAQVLTPGYIIVLQANGKQYEYHTDQHEEIVVCDTVGNMSINTSMVLDTADNAVNTTNPQNTQSTNKTKLSGTTNDTMLVDGGPNQPIEGGDVIITTTIDR